MTLYNQLIVAAENFGEKNCCLAQENIVRGYGWPNPTAWQCGSPCGTSKQKDLCHLATVQSAKLKIFFCSSQLPRMKKGGRKFSKKIWVNVLTGWFFYSLGVMKSVRDKFSLIIACNAKFFKRWHVLDERTIETNFIKIRCFFSSEHF